ncbi:MAG: cellulose synthase operon protein YhjQ/BcsQ [Snowella sp.]|nr:cellulose synthase operon protein YhjQ/BcsQ [Snowella sp.]
MDTLQNIGAEMAAPQANWWTAVQRYWLVALLTATTVSGGIAYWVLQAPGLYRTQSLILVGTKVSVPVVQSEETNSQEKQEENLLTEIEVLKSQSLLSKAISKLEPAYQGITPGMIAQNLTLFQPKDTSVLSVSYEDADPVQAKRILEALVATYLEYGKNSQRSPVTNAIQFIEARLPAARESLEKTANELTNFRIVNNLEDIETSLNLAYNNKEAIRNKITEAELNLHQTEQQYAELQRQLTNVEQNPDTLLSDSILSQDTTYQSVLKQLQALTLEYRLAQTRFTADHPAIQNLKDQIDELNRLLAQSSRNVVGDRGSQMATRKRENGEILQELAGQLTQVQINLATQRKQLPKLRQQEQAANFNFNRLLKLQQKYRTLKLRETTHIKSVDALSEKLQELRIREAQETSTWKVIEPPQLPAEAVDKNRNRGIVLALLAGLLSGVGVALWLERLDRRFSSIQELKQILPVPILGTIPHSQGDTTPFKSPQLQLTTQSNPFTEAIRSLSLALSLQTSNRKGQVIALTATSLGEGTTTMTYNLGLALAELGKRVLIVDTNLADPKLHQVFSFSNIQGLTTAIATDLTWQSIIHSTAPQIIENYLNSGPPISTNGTNGNKPNNPSPNQKFNPVFAQVLTAPASVRTNPLTLIHQSYPDVLTAGPVINSSFLWLVSPKMQLMLDQWRQVYDYILMDTSALTELADAQSILPKVDEVLLVVNLKKAERSTVMETLETLRRNRSQVAGVIVNYAN